MQVSIPGLYKHININNNTDYRLQIGKDLFYCEIKYITDIYI